MNKYKPQVKDISLFKEITQNIINPLEILRKALSNSHDDKAKNISIIVYRNDTGNFAVEIQDDGKGMRLDDIQRFFNLGDSNKGEIGIGEKGLGTKTYFKSKRITLYTQTKDNESYKAVTDEPWKSLCNNLLPEYIVERNDSKLGNIGTSVMI